MSVFIAHFYGGVKLGKCHFEITSMLTTAALSAYQYRVTRRKVPLTRAFSQESLASITSGGSDNASGVEDNEHQETKELTSQDEHFSSATETISDNQEG